MSAVCEVNTVPRSRPGRFTGLWCGEPATVRVEFGCVHEHVKAEDVCAQHAERVVRSDSELTCAECWQAGHQCPITGRIAVPGGAR